MSFEELLSKVSPISEHRANDDGPPRSRQSHHVAAHVAPSIYTPQVHNLVEAKKELPCCC